MLEQELVKDLSNYTSINLTLDKLKQSRDVLGLVDLGVLEVFVEHLQ